MGGISAHIRNRDRGPWYHNDAQRVRFDGAARMRYRDALHIGTSMLGGRTYRIALDVYGFDVRVPVRIEFRPDNPTWPIITLPPDDDSPHRYTSTRPCMWHPDDPKERRWVFEDGLLELIRHIHSHLFKEMWFAETGQWLGDEVPHHRHERKVPDDER